MREREEALAKFRESLSRPLTERFYEEDELIDYFDFASDFNDDYLRMEALMCAARLYPNSEEMLQRKAVFYSDYSEETITKYLEDNQHSSGIIWDIARARIAFPETPEEQKKVLESIVSGYNELSDEDVIQFVELITSFRQLQWLKDNLDKIENKTLYPSSLLYETAIAAELHKDIDYAIELLERLTELEPFNADFWISLSKGYMQNNQSDKALSALEYAIAIEPENPLSLYLKARLLFMTNGNPEEILSLSKKIEELGGMNREMLKITGLIYQSVGESQRAIDAYERFIHRFPDQEKEALLDMITFCPQDSEKILERLSNISKGLSIWNWTEWAESFEEMGAKAQAAAVILTIYRKNEISEVPFSLLEISFRLGLFHITDILAERYSKARWKTEAQRAAGNSLSEDENEYERDEVDRIFYLIAIITKLKLGKTDEARKLADEASDRNFVNYPDRTASKLLILGFYGLLEHIIRHLRQSEDKYPWDKFDPFGYWHDEYSDSDIKKTN